MSDMKNVLFVCTGNTCRSPLAEAMFRHATAHRDDFQAGSAGLAARAGSRRNPQTEALLKKLGIPQPAFASRQISDSLLANATHVFGMTRSHLDMLEERFPAHSDKFYLMCEFADIPGLGIGADVSDPIGLGPEAYEEVAGMFEIAIPAIVEFIDQTWKPADR